MEKGVGFCSWHKAEHELFFLCIATLCGTAARYAFSKGRLLVLSTCRNRPVQLISVLEGLFVDNPVCTILAPGFRLSGSQGSPFCLFAKRLNVRAVDGNCGQRIRNRKVFFSFFFHPGWRKPSTLGQNTAGAIKQQQCSFWPWQRAWSFGQHRCTRLRFVCPSCALSSWCGTRSLPGSQSQSCWSAGNLQTDVSKMNIWFDQWSVLTKLFRICGRGSPGGFGIGRDMIGVGWLNHSSGDCVVFGAYRWTGFSRNIAHILELWAGVWKISTA